MLSLRIGIVYCFLNLINRKRYIGSTKNSRDRFYGYWRGFKNGKCHNFLLQRAFLKYGADAFKVIILEEVPVENDTTEWFKARLLYAEQFWMDYYASWARECGYNISSTAGSPLGVKWSKESKKKQSKVQKKRWEDPNERKKVSESTKKVWEDPKLRKKQSKAQIRRWMDPKQRKKMSKVAKKVWKDSKLRRKQRNTTTEYWKEPTKKEEASKKLKKYFKDHPEIGKQHSEDMIKYWENPTTRKEQSKRLKKYWEAHPNELAKKQQKTTHTRRLNSIYYELEIEGFL